MKRRVWILTSAAIALACAAAMAMAMLATGLGTIELKEGTTYTIVNSTSLDSTVRGTLTNELNNGDVITGIEIIIRPKNGAAATAPTSGKVTITNAGEMPAEVNAVNGSTHSRASFPEGTFPGQINGSGNASIEFENVTPAGSADTEFCFAPDVSDKPKASGAASNTLPNFAMKDSRDLVRQKISSMWRDRLAFHVFNADERLDLTAFDGTVLFPAGSSATITDVFLQDPNDAHNEPPGTSISTTSDTFSISGFPSLNYRQSYEVVVVFSTSFSGDTVRVAIEAAFD